MKSQALEKHLQNTHMKKDCVPVINLLQLSSKSILLRLLRDRGGGLDKYFTCDFRYASGGCRRKEFSSCFPCPAERRCACPSFLYGSTFSIPWLLQRAVPLAPTSGSAGHLTAQLLETSLSTFSKWCASGK